MTLEEKRLILREKVEAGKARLADRDLLSETKEAADKAKDDAAHFLEKHPIAVIAGAVAIGLFLGTRGKKTPAKGRVRNDAVKAFLVDAAIGIGLKMIDNARDRGSRSTK